MRATAEPGQALPRIDFVAEADTCPECRGPMRIAKSRCRTVVTLAEGAFGAREVLKRCAREKPCRVVGSEALARVVRTRQRYGYDLIVHVGLARFLGQKQRDEIRAELHQQRGIEISAGTVSQLCDRFLVLLETLHVLRAPYLRAAMHGGYPLHFDATSDHGKGGLFVCMDGWRRWVLWAARIPTENQIHLRPQIDKTVALFGTPVASVRDMGDGGAGAVAHLREQGIPDLICHYHFLGAVGTKLFDPPYTSLRNMLRRCALRTDLRALLRALHPYRESGPHEERFGPGRVREELLALVLWLLEGTGAKDLTFPFALPHLELVRRCRGSSEPLERWVPYPRSQAERRAIVHLGGLVRKLERDPRFAAAVDQLEASEAAFGELRDILRLSNAELPRGDARNTTRDLPALEVHRVREIQKALEQYRADLQRRIPVQRARTDRSPHAIILSYLKEYGELLFGHPVRRDEDGHVVAVVERTNNIPEHFFGRAKQRLRRRVGRAHLGGDLDQQPAQVALVPNLLSPTYVRLVCGSLDNLPAAFAAVQAQCASDRSGLRDQRDADLRRCVRALLKHEAAHADDRTDAAQASMRASATVS